VAAFIPLFTMTGVEGKIFGPMATTYGFALVGALILALTFSPVMASLVLKPQHDHRETLFVRGVRSAYSRIIGSVLRFPRLALGATGLALLASLALLPFVGGEFMPKLEEGNLWVRASMPNTISYSYATELANQMRQVFGKYPAVATVVSQLGRPDDGTDPTSYFSCEFFVALKPRDEWPAGVTKEKMVEEMERDLERIPGVTYNFSQVIQDNVEESMSGVKGENVIKLFGDDLEKLEETARKIATVMGTVPGVADLGVFGQLGQPNLLIRADRTAAARYGVLPGDVNAAVQAAIGGQAVTQVLEGERRFDVVVRFLPEFRSSLEAISNIPISTPEGVRLPLKQVAEITRQSGASFIYREGNARYIPIKFSVRGRDLQSTIAEAERRIRESVEVPEGYRFEWAGEFQALRKAVERLQIVVPISLLIIFFLLYGIFRTIGDALLLLGTVPLAMIGGILSLVVTGTNFSISAAVGFISLFGVTVLGGVILVSRFKQLREEGLPLYDAVLQGSQLQLRPVLMAALAAAIGLVPASLATGIGSETQKPLARVVVGGMTTSAVLILVVLPAMYLVMHRILERHTSGSTAPEQEGIRNILRETE
jgi:cobalt-zinc-cadmium resistance protein CzcA